MFSWITGPRITNVIQDLQTDPAYDTTFIEPPDTPAHQFAVKAFKQAVFGTPAPQDLNAGKKLEKKAKIDAANAKTAELPAPKEDAPPSSPSKQPNGILMTPGTANKGRKTVSFGAQVIDNEGKKGGIGKSGIPNDCPGKFPSPWTPGTELRTDVASDTKPRTKLTAALYDARTIAQPKPGQKPKAKDDSDITIDLGAPRSESGKYWKEQYETYAERSEKQMKQLVAKQHVAKNYAKKKDGEAMEAATRLAEERKRFRNRERELEQQNKEYQERLRKAMAEKFAAGVEITALKNRIAVLEKSLAVSSSEVQSSKMSFQIYEDSNKGSSNLLAGQGKPSEDRSRTTLEPPSIILGNSVRSSCILPEEKENSPPKPRHTRRQTLPDTSSRLATSHSITPSFAAEPKDISKTLARSTAAIEASSNSILAPRRSELALKSPISARRSEPSIQPKSPKVAPSSPLPQPSPDPWMDMNDSPAPPMDRLALPISSGPSYSKPAKTSHNRNRASMSVSHATTTKSEPKPDRLLTKLESRAATSNTSKEPATRDTKPNPSKASRRAEEMPAQDPKFDISKAATHHAEGSSQVTRDRALPLPSDRAENAKRRLLERKQRRLNS